MAETSSKHTIDTTAAVKAVDKVTAALGKYNEAVKTGKSLQTQQNRITDSAIKKTEQYRDAVMAAKTQTAGLARNMEKTNEKRKIENRELGKVIRNLSKFNDQIKLVNAAMRAKNKGLGLQATAVKKDATATAGATRAQTAFAAAIGRTTAAQARSATTQALFNRRMAQGAAMGPSQVRNHVLMNRHLVTTRVSQDQYNRAQFLSIQRSERAAAAQQNYARSVAHSRNNLFELTFSLKNVARIAAGLLLHRAFLRFTQSIIQSVRDAKDFERAVSEIKTISQSARISFVEWRSELQLISGAFGVERINAAEAAYQALSNQVVNGRDTFSFLTEEVKLATVATTSLDTAVATTTAILNAFHFETSAATRVNAILFKTVEEGRLRLEDLANTIGRVSILSNQLGVSFIEQQAAITLLTKQGIKAEEAITLLRNVELKLIKPTERMKEVFEEWGVTSGQSAIETFGLVGVIQKLAKMAQESGDSASELGEIFGRLRAIVGAAALTQNKFTEEIDKFTDANVSATEAFNQRMDSLDKRADQQLQRLRNAFVNKFGLPLLKMLVLQAEAWGGLDAVFARVVDTGGQLVRVFLVYKSTVFAVSLTQALWNSRLLQSAFGMNNLTTSTVAATNATRAFNASRAAATLGVTLAIEAIIRLATASSRAAADIELMQDQLRMQALEEGVKRLSKFSNAISESSETARREWSNSLRTFQVLNAELQARNTQLEKSFKITWERIGESILDGIEPPLDMLRKKLDGLKKDAEGKLKIVADRRREVDKKDIDEAVRLDVKRAGEKKSPEARVNALRVIRDKLIRSRDAALAGGDLEGFDDFNRRIDTLTADIESRLKTFIAKAGKTTDIESKFRRREFDPLTGRFRIRSGTEKTGEKKADPEGEAAALRALKDLDAARATEVERRLAAERDYLALLEAEAVKEKALVAAREKGFNRFEDILAKIDTLVGQDPVDVPEARTKLTKLIAEADKAARAAGLSDEKRLGFLREANAARLALADKERINAAKKLLDINREALKTLNADAEAGLKKRNEALQKAANAFAKDIPTATGPTLGILGHLGLKETTALIGGPKSDAASAARVQKRFDAALRAAQGAQERLKSAEGLKAQKKAADELADALGDVRQELFIIENQFADRLQKRAVFDKEKGRFGDFKLLNKKQLAEARADLAVVIDKIKEVDAPVRVAAEEFGKVQDRIKAVKAGLERIPPELLKLAKAAEEATAKRLEGEKAVHAVLDGTILRLIKIARLTREGDGGGGLGGGGFAPPARAFGGPMPRLAFGGSPRGIDRMPAMLAEGETVMTQAASAAFSPMLAAMNRTTMGLRGGTTQSVNFGDTHIHVPSGTTDVQVDAIVSALQRKARQGALNLGG